MTLQGAVDAAHEPSDQHDPEADPEAEYHAFFSDNYRTLSRLAYLLTGSHEAADDVAAEALTAAWRNWGRVRSADSPLAYVRRMVANIAASRLRRLVRERRAMTSVASMVDRTPPGTDVPAVIDVRAALLKLPTRKRACVVLRYAFDLSEEETANTLGISVGTVKSQTSKAVAELERMLDPAGTASGRGTSSGRGATSGRATSGRAATSGHRTAKSRSGTSTRAGRQRGGTARATPSTGSALGRFRDIEGPNRAARSVSVPSEVHVHRPLHGEAM